MRDEGRVVLAHQAMQVGLFPTSLSAQAHQAASRRAACPARAPSHVARLNCFDVHCAVRIAAGRRRGLRAPHPLLRDAALRVLYAGPQARALFGNSKIRRGAARRFSRGARRQTPVVSAK
jgi:hypothetical protein